MKPFFLLIFLVFQISLTAQDKAKNKELDQFIKQGIKDWEIPGLAVTVVQKGKVLYQETYGVRDIETGSKVDEHTLFSMGSTTKAVVSLALAMLVEEGKLSWKDRIIDHVSYFQLSDPFITREVRVKDLLTHNLGLQRNDMLWLGGEFGVEEVIRRMKHAPFTFSLRSSFAYNNIMYAVAGEVISSVTGQAWHEFLRQRILEPLEMNDARLLAAEVQASDNATKAHNKIDDRVRIVPTTFSDDIGPAGMIWASIEDMSHYLQFLSQDGLYQGDTLLGPEQYEYLYQPQVLIPQDQFYPTTQLTKPHWTSYGLSWFQHDYKGEKVDFHTGSLHGLIAICGQLRDHDLAVYVLSNMDHAELRHAIMYKVFDLFALGGNRDWHQDILDLYRSLSEKQEAKENKEQTSQVKNTKTTLPLKDYTGEYLSERWGKMTISLEEGQLVMDLNEGKIRGKLEHFHYDTFLMKHDFAPYYDGQKLTFSLGNAGNIDQLTWISYTFNK